MSFIKAIRGKWLAPEQNVIQNERNPKIHKDRFVIEPIGTHSGFQKATEASLPTPQQYISSIATRYIGFGRRLDTLLRPLNYFDSKHPEEIQEFFSKNLAEVVKLSHMRPKAAHSLIVKRSIAGQTLYQRLVSIACGDTRLILPTMDTISRSKYLDEPLLLDCLRNVAKYRPYEATHLITRLFSRASTKTRLAILKEFVASPVLGDKQTVGDLFISLLSRSTVEERKDEIYPSILSIIHEGNSNLSQVQVKKGFLAALLRGWMSES